MPAWIGAVLAASNAGLSFRRPRLGLIVYAVLALTVPHVDLLGRSITYEIVAIPGVALATIAARSKISNLRFHILVLAYLVVVVASTVVATLKYPVSVEWIRLQGLLRFAVILGLVREVLDRSAIRTVVGLVLLVNIVVAGLQLAIPGAAELFFELYGRQSQAVLERYAGQGRILRPVGTMESPVRLGAIGLFGFAVAYASMLRGRSSPEDKRLMALAVLAGILSATKTFIVGMPLVLGVGGLVKWFSIGTGPRLSFPRIRPRSAGRMAFFGLLIVGAAAGGAAWLQQQQIPIGYYLEFLVDPQGVFSTRFGVGGSLTEAIGVISDNWVLGVGMTLPDNEFLGDSGYVNLAHDAGLIGVGLITVIVMAVGYRFVRNGRIFRFIVLAAVMAIGTGVSWFTTLEGALAIVFLATEPGRQEAGRGRERTDEAQAS